MKRRRRKPNEIVGAADRDSLIADHEPESEPDPGRDYVARLQTGLGNAAFARLVSNRREAGDVPVLPGAGGASGLSRLSLMRSLPRAGAIQREPAAAIQRAPSPPTEAPAVPRAEDIVKTRFPHLAEAMKPEHYKAIDKVIAWRLRREKLNQQIIDFDRREREKQEREGWAAPGSNSYKFAGEYQDKLRRLQNKAEDAPDVTHIELDTSVLIDRAILAPQEWNIKAEEEFRKRWVVGLASKPTVLTLLGDFPIEEGFKGPFWNGIPLPTDGGRITWDKLLDIPGAITDYYENVKWGSPVARAAKEYLAKLQGAWNKAESEYQSERERKGEFPIVSKITEFFSSEIDIKAAEKFLPPGKSYKDMDPWEIMQFLGSLDEAQLDRVKRVLISSDDYLKIYEHLLKVDTAVAIGQYEAALIAMPMVCDEIEEFYRKTVTYGQRVNAAASSIVTTLQYVRAGCNIVLTVGGGVMGKAYGLVGISAGSAAGAATGTFTQETAMQLAQGKFDPGSILFKTGKDAAMTFIGSMIGGALGSKFASLLGPRLATVIPNEAVLQFVVARVADVGAGLLTTPIDITVTGMLEGNWPKSMDDLLEKVAINTVTSVVVGGAVDWATHVPNIKGKSWDAMTEADLPSTKLLGEGTAKPGETTTTPETPGGAKPGEAKTTTDTTGDPTGAGKAAIDTAQAKTGQTTPADVQTGATGGAQAAPRSRVVSESAEIVSIDRTKPIGASGFEGSTASRKGYGVFDAKIKLPNGQEIDAVVKIVKPKKGAANAEFFANEVAGAKAAAETGYGPEFYGVVETGDAWAFAMSKVQGGFTENYARLGEPGYAKAQTETEAAINALTPQTGQDVRNYGDALWKLGYAAGGDLQGLVGSDGRWRPIDFSSVKKVPADPVEATLMETTHKSAVEAEASLYDKQLAQRDAAKAGKSGP